MQTKFLFQIFSPIRNQTVYFCTYYLSSGDFFYTPFPAYHYSMSLTYDDVPKDLKARSIRPIHFGTSLRPFFDTGTFVLLANSSHFSRLFLYITGLHISTKNAPFLWCLFCEKALQQPDLRNTSNLSRFSIYHCLKTQGIIMSKPNWSLCSMSFKFL